jgi:hypothetical protein
MLSGPGFQDLDAKFQDPDLRTWVSSSRREVSGPGSQDLGFRTSKALHPTVVLSFLCVHRHFSSSFVLFLLLLLLLPVLSNKTNFLLPTVLRDSLLLLLPPCFYIAKCCCIWLSGPGLQDLDI